jgi:hypothetical protein
MISKNENEGTVIGQKHPRALTQPSPAPRSTWPAQPVACWRATERGHRAWMAMAARSPVAKSTIWCTGGVCLSTSGPRQMRWAR